MVTVVTGSAWSRKLGQIFRRPTCSMSGCNPKVELVQDRLQEQAGSGAGQGVALAEAPLGRHLGSPRGGVLAADKELDRSAVCMHQADHPVQHLELDLAWGVRELGGVVGVVQVQVSHQNAATRGLHSRGVACHPALQ